ncbi:MAG: AraC family transcriptional regulator [Marinifilaceae bacterium]
MTIFNSIDEMLNLAEFKRLADVFRTISFKPLEVYPRHAHERIEISYVKKGSCLVTSDEGVFYFKQDELMIITSNVHHAFQAGSKGCTLLQLEFLPNIFDMISPFSSTTGHSQTSVNAILFSEHHIIKIINEVRIMQTMQRIITEMNARQDFYKHLVIINYAELLVHIYRYLNDSFIPGTCNKTICKAVEYIKLNYHNDITAQHLVNHTGIGDRYLRKLFTDHLNTTPVEYINQCRINKSVELLRITDMSIKEICFLCGFKSPQYFSRTFKKVLGITPKEIKLQTGH